MEVVKTLLVIVYWIIAVILTTIILMQSKDDEGMSETVMGGNFLEKNKSRTKEGKLKNLTIILAIIFTILTIVLGIVYMI